MEYPDGMILVSTRTPHAIAMAQSTITDCCRAGRSPRHQSATAMASTARQTQIIPGLKNRNGTRWKTSEGMSPWKTLGADTPPQANTLLGISAAINDRDEPKPKQLEPSAIGIFELKDTHRFGLLYLEE